MPETPDLAKYQEQLLEIVRRSQDAMIEASRSFADNATSIVPGDTSQIEKLIDSAFDFTDKVIKTQREFTKSVLDTVTNTVTGGTSD